MERAATSPQTYARCLIEHRDSCGTYSSDKTYDSQEFTDGEQLVAAITDAIVGCLLPRTAMLVADVSANVLEHGSTYIPEDADVAKAVDHFIEAAHALQEAYQTYLKG